MDRIQERESNRRRRMRTQKNIQKDYDSGELERRIKEMESQLEDPNTPEHQKENIRSMIEVDRATLRRFRGGK